MSHVPASRATIRPTTGGDLAALKIIDAVDLFPSEMLDEMIAPFLARATQLERWLTAEVDGAPAAMALLRSRAYDARD